MNNFKENQKKFTSLEEVANNYIKDINLKKETGLLTHYHEWDKISLGLKNSDLIVIAARPAIGKTALALNIAQNIASKNNKKILVISLEMSKETLFERMLAAETKIDSLKIRNNNFKNAEKKKIIKASKKLGNFSILFNNSAEISIESIKNESKKIKVKIRI